MACAVAYSNGSGSSGGSGTPEDELKKEIVSEEDKYKWDRIGTVLSLLMYPIDHGTGYEMESAICTDDGLEHEGDISSEERNIKDRRLVAFDNNNEIYLRPSTNLANLSRNVLYYGPSEDFENDETPDMEKITKNYLGAPITIRNRTEEKDSLRGLYKTHSFGKLNVGYFSAKDRTILNNSKRYTEENNNVLGFLPNYSHFTLVNTESLQTLRDKYRGYISAHNRGAEEADKITDEPDDISYLNYVPHIVMKGDRGSAFQEESVKAVKIGNVEFHKILPCVHEACTLNYNYVKNDSPFQHYAQYLPRVQALKKKFNEYSEDSELPVCGINMERKGVIKPDESVDSDDHNEEHNTIALNDVIYVKYFIKDENN